MSVIAIVQLAWIAGFLHPHARVTLRQKSDMTHPKFLYPANQRFPPFREGSENLDFRKQRRRLSSRAAIAEISRATDGESVSPGSREIKISTDPMHGYTRARAHVAARSFRDMNPN